MRTIDLTRMQIKRILVIKWSAMGDVVISTAMMEDIYRAFPDAEIHLNAMPPWDRLIFADDQRFRKIISIDLRGRQKGLRGIWQWFNAVRREHYDLIIDLQSNDRSRMLVTLLSWQIPWRMGNHRRFPYNIAAEPYNGKIHAFDLQQRALEAGGIQCKTLRPTLRVPQRNYERVAELQSRYGLVPGEYAILLPGSQAAGHLKRWGAVRYAELIKLLQGDGVSKFVLVGGKDELDECRRIVELSGPGSVVNVCGETEVLDIVPLCKDARFVVGNDTGTAHMASCTDRPIVVICGPTDPLRVKPVGENVVTLQAELDCVNCYRKECDHHTCMSMITPAMVRDRLVSLCRSLA